MPEICAAVPNEFRSEDIDDFVALVTAGGEVSANGLRNRVMQSPQIAFVREGECLLGVAGLKTPRESYRTRIALASKTAITEKDFPFELGWAFILPSAQGRRLSFPLCRSLITAANGGGIFSTSRITKDRMHHTLEKLGFSRTGTEWASKENDGDLALFLRPAVRPSVR